MIFIGKRTVYSVRFCYQNKKVIIDKIVTHNDYFYLITKANADVGGEQVNNLLEKFCCEHPNAKLVSSLG